MEFFQGLRGTRHRCCPDRCFPECQFQFRRRTVKADAQELVNEPGQSRPWSLDAKLIAAVRNLLCYFLRSCQHQLDREVGWSMCRELQQGLISGSEIKTDLFDEGSS